LRHARPRRLAPLVALVALALPAPAAAHVRSGVVAVGMRATVDPAPAGLSVRVDRSDLALRLAVAPGRAALVLGYTEEPFLRVDARGVAVNAASPTAAVTGLAKPGHGWRTLSSGRTVTWHDARIRSMRHDVQRRRWSVPVTVDGRPEQLSGATERVAAPPWWPWLLVAAPFALAAALRLRSERTAVALGATAGVATLVTALAFALDRYASAGTIVESINEVLLALAGLAVLWFVRRPPAARFGVAAGLGTLAAFIGLTKVASLTHGVVLSVLPATATRVLVAVALSAGAGAVVLGARFFLEEV
jgi:hypothetical protein